MSIPKYNITIKNLNLLSIFHALLESKSVSAAAKRLNMSQPNISRALKVLREEFKDPLFVRSSHGIAPTQRALDLKGPLKEAMLALESVYKQPTFDLRTERRTFTIGTTDYNEFLFAPSLSATVMREAPGITLNFRPSDGVLPKSQMESGACDLSILVVRELIPPGYHRQNLFLDPYVCAVRSKHPILSGKINIDRFLEFGHVMINPQGTLWAITDEKLKKFKKQRHLVLGTPNALSSTAAIAKSDLILTATKRFIEASQEFFSIETFEPLFKMEPISVALIWHERVHHDPLHQWIRNKLKELV